MFHPRRDSFSLNLERILSVVMTTLGKEHERSEASLACTEMQRKVGVDGGTVVKQIVVTISNLRLQAYSYYKSNTVNSKCLFLPGCLPFSTFFFHSQEKKKTGSVGQDVECVCVGQAQRQITKQLCVSASE